MTRRLISQCGICYFTLVHYNNKLLQVAALAPLALLLVLEARCVHFVISINIVCCGVVHHCSHTAHTCIHDDKLVTRYKDVSEHHCDAMGTVVPMSKVDSSWTWVSGLCI